MNNTLTIYCNLSNGNQAQVILQGDVNAMIKFIENYEGDDLGNDMLLQDFVIDFTETGVIVGNA